MNACFTWAQSLHNLLKDSDGVALFLRYLESEGPQYADPLRFWFACEGLKIHKQAEKIERLVKLIYKNYFMKSALPIGEELRKHIMRNLKSPQCLEPPITLFDEAQAEIEYLINKTTYPNFLKSDMYLQYLQSVEDPISDNKELSNESSASSSPIGNKEIGNLASGIGPLPTLHEGMEFTLNSQPPGTSVSTGYHTPAPRLTKNMLLASQEHRFEIRPKFESYIGINSRNGVHAGYNSYNPVSRQDSELQSISSHSDARTESDNMSISESLMDGRISGRSRHRFDEKQARQSAARNRETNMNLPFISRTQRVDAMDMCRPMDCQEHAALLIQKLELVRREQESQEQFQRRLKESESLNSLDDKPSLVALPQFADDNDQDILDAHVSRVFSDGLASPRPPHSPQPAAAWPARRARRPADVFSSFSGDSGNVTDAAFDRAARPASARRSAGSRRTLTDLTDSGVSVASDCAPPREARVLTWLLEAHRRGHGARRGGSRASSLERGAPAQPFIADPSMPPLPSPNTDVQLEETRRRLEDENVRRMRAQRVGKYQADGGSGASTLRRGGREKERVGGVGAEDVTTVVFSFCDEQYPYRTKIPGSQITLRQFKEYLPKKGNYRYFFRTVCEDLPNEGVHEEVSSDSEVLPLWEGKIMAQVKQIFPVVNEEA